ncbi:hypothetical protein PAK_04766, partial [Pseudomonas aeruginosa PAK]
MNGFTECDLENEKKRPWALFVGRADNRIAVVRRFGDETGRSQILKLST